MWDRHFFGRKKVDFEEKQIWNTMKDGKEVRVENKTAGNVAAVMKKY